MLSGCTRVIYVLRAGQKALEVMFAVRNLTFFGGMAPLGAPGSRCDIRAASPDTGFFLTIESTTITVADFTSVVAVDTVFRALRIRGLGHLNPWYMEWI
jgi:hypothetical protein